MQGILPFFLENWVETDLIVKWKNLEIEKIVIYMHIIWVYSLRVS